MAAIFDELGLDVDVPGLHVDMTEEDAAPAAAQLAHELRRAAESRDAAQLYPRGEKTARAAEERGRRHEQLRKDSLGGVYRRLVKELHPDLELDPAERERGRAVSCTRSRLRTRATTSTPCCSSKSSGLAQPAVTQLA